MKNFLRHFCGMVFGVLLLTTPCFTKAQSATTFPVDQAGIAAYVKLGAITQEHFENAKQSLFEFVESSGETYMIGIKAMILPIMAAKRFPCAFILAAAFPESNTLTFLLQQARLKDGSFITAAYNNDRTRITGREDGEVDSKTVTGLKVLDFATKKGAIEWGY